MMFFGACARSEDSPPEGRERAEENAPAQPIDHANGPTDEAGDKAAADEDEQTLLFIYPRLSKRLQGELAEPMSEPRELQDERGRTFMLGVRVDEGTPIELGEGKGISQTARLDLYAFEPELDRESLLYRFTLRLNEGPEYEPTDDLLIARAAGSSTRITLERRALNDPGTAPEPEGERVEEIHISREGGEWKVERIYP